MARKLKVSFASDEDSNRYMFADPTETDAEQWEITVTEHGESPRVKRMSPCEVWQAGTNYNFLGFGERTVALCVSADWFAEIVVRVPDEPDPILVLDDRSTVDEWAKELGLDEEEEEEAERKKSGDPPK